MEEMVKQALAELDGDESEHSDVDDIELEPLPESTQLEIITKCVKQKNGTYLTGTGKAFKRPPLPRGGPRNSSLKEQLKVKDDTIQHIKELYEKRIRALEDAMMQGGSGNMANNIGSEGETSCGPHNDN